MARPRFFRDPIHGQIRFNRLVLDSDFSGIDPGNAEDQIGWLLPNLINCKAFQRLRHVRQNGLTNLVFHGMEHSRFSHSMGVSFLACQMYERIVRNSSLEQDPQRQLAVATASLLHDIGHGPFSHTIEEALNDSHPEKRKWFNHEVMTSRILTEDEEINGKLRAVSDTFPSYVAAYIDRSQRPEDHWTYRLISSQLDADRLDYLMRDTKQAGLQTHGFDLYRLLDMLFFWKGRVVVDRHATEAVEAYLLTLEHVYKTIYFHHGVRGASVLLGSILKRAFVLHQEGDASVFSDSNGGPTNPLRALMEKGEAMEIGEYIRLGEFHVWHLVENWQYSRDAILSDLSRRLMQRQRFRSMEYEPGYMSKFMSECEGRIAKLVCDKLPFTITKEDALMYYVLVDDPKRVGYKTYNWGVSEGKTYLKDDAIWLFSSGGREPVPIEQENENGIFNALKKINHFHRFVFPHEVLEGVKALPYFS